MKRLVAKTLYCMIVSYRVDQSRIHWRDEPDFSGRQHAEGFRSHEECKRSRPLLSVLLDDSIRPVKHGRRNREADLIRGHQVDHQLELHRLLDGKVSRLGALQDLVDISSSISPFGNVTRSVGHHTTVVHIISPSTYRRQPI